LLFAKEGVSRSELDALLPAFRDDWLQLVTEILGKSPSIERGVHVLHFDGDAQAAAAGYISKVAKEITAGDLKSGRDPFSLLDGVRDGDAQSQARWIEFADAMKGKQSISWSKNLRRRLGLDRELTDEEVAQLDEEVGVEVGGVEAHLWNAAVREGKVWVYLEDAERSVGALGLQFLADHVT
jgi:hypothetical protein